ncbi:MAG: macro domain-containing protein [Tissierellia bacterium]|jgi:O-acetyl-ADP-ribose deacetylase (regulator of RNase III)|nr:macro domain-containing protein [Bacillota bacterium]NLL22310.1 macro domain-containing protein [Tissierellia bacterium]
MAFYIREGDITRFDGDAVVNAANTQLRMGGGVCGAIFRAAGEAELKQACRRLRPIQTGEAVITPGFSLTASFIIHTAGPVYEGGHRGEETLLRNSYINSMSLALKNNLRSIAFPLISSGIYGYPVSEALQIALDSIESFILADPLDVTLYLFSLKNYLDDETIPEELKTRIQDRLV